MWDDMQWSFCLIFKEYFMKKFLLIFCLIIFVIIFLIKFFANDILTHEIRKINKTSNVLISSESMNFSLPSNVDFKNLKVVHKKSPFYVEFNNFKSKLLLKNLLTLAIKTKSEGTLYDGTVTSTFWTGVRSDIRRGDLFIKDLNISQYPLLQMLPIEGGFLTLNGFNFAFNQKGEVHYLGGDVDFSNFKIIEKIKIPHNLSKLPIDIDIPMINIKKLIFAYKYKENVLYLDNLILDSDLLNLKSTCYIDLNKKDFRKCSFNFDFSQKGWKELKNWVFILTQGKIQERKAFTLDLSESIYNPKQNLHY